MKYFWILLGAGLNVLGDILLKRWSLGKIHIAWGMLAYLADALVWAKILKDGNNMSSSMAIWEVLAVLMVVWWVVAREGETLSTMSWIGILVSIVGVGLIEYGHD